MAHKKLWLIDAGYLYNAQNSMGQDYNFDYLKLRNKLEEFGEIWRAYYLNSIQGKSSEVQDGFHRWLQSAPPNGPKIITKLYPLKTFPIRDAYCTGCNRKVQLTCPEDSRHYLNKQQQKGVDVGIATLALTHRDHYDTLVLSSGDGDLLDAVDYLTEQGKRLELLVFKAGVSPDLQARSDAIHWIDDFADEISR